MGKTRIKICGLTDPGQARLAAGLGAEFIGIVLAESSRCVQPDRAGEIVRALHGLAPAVGVFVDAPAGRINQTARRCGLAIAQLHGQEPPEILSEIEIPCIKAFRIRGGESIAAIGEWLARIEPGSSLQAVLLDACVPGARGGTGERFNWELIPQARQRGDLAEMPPIILAGGLDPDNVAQAIEIVQPWAVDVSSGVESAPGQKDPARIRAFIEAVRSAD